MIKEYTKEEKKEIKQEFLESEKSIVYKKAQKIFLLCIVGIIYALAVTPYDIYNKSGIWSYVLDGLLLIFSIACAFKLANMKRKELYKYLISKNQKNTKSTK